MSPQPGHLALDIARCVGVKAGPQGLNPHPVCQDCMRRLAHRPEGSVRFMEPVKQFPCEYRIAPEFMGS